MSATPLLQIKHISKTFVLPKPSLFASAPHLRALHNISATIEAGRSLGIVGESGSGKTSLARLVMALDQPTQGEVLFEGKALHTLPSEELRQLRKHFQMVFQDPFGSLDPRQQVKKIVCEPLQHDQSKESIELAQQALSDVGLSTADLEKYPHEFSGGQRQRIAIARALITRPKLIVADEPVSALDVSVQAQVLNLMLDLQEKYGLSYLLISHDLAVVKVLCDEVMVLKNGEAVEQGKTEDIFQSPSHPYTLALLNASPD